MSGTAHAEGVCGQRDLNAEGPHAGGRSWGKSERELSVHVRTLENGTWSIAVYAHCLDGPSAHHQNDASKISKFNTVC